MERRLQYFGRRTQNVRLILLTLAATLTIFQDYFCLGADYGDPCDYSVDASWSHQCDKQHVLTCRSGTCDCAYTWMVYHEVHRLCLSPADKHCGLDRNYWILECVEHATCKDITVGANSTATTTPPVFACVCNDGFVPTTKKDCADEHFLPNSTFDPYAPVLCCAA